MMRNITRPNFSFFSFFADHCPWVNNCVGIGNHKYFLLFIFYTCISCIYSFTLVVTRFFSCMSRHGHVRQNHLTCLDHPQQLLSILGLIVEAILFGLFTSCMMIDQAGVVTSKMTHIDRLKGEDDGLGGSSLSGVIEVFGLSNMKVPSGRRFRSDWLSPFAKICFPASLQDEIMGFCRPCIGGGNKTGETELAAQSLQMVRSVAEIV
jgi:palmitoyltransferase